MPTLKLTDAAVQRLKAPPGGRVDYFDATLPGFALRVAGATNGNPEGRKTWTLFYRFGGKQKRLTLAPTYPALGLAEARRKAGDALAGLGEGKDPGVERRERQAEAKAAAVRVPDTIANVADLFIARALEAKSRAPRYVAETRRNFANHVLPRWGDRDIKTITRRDVIELLDAIADAPHAAKPGKTAVRGGPIAANRVLAAIRALFNFAIRRGILEASPVGLVERPGKETRRDRALTADEIRTLWPHMAELGHPFGPYLQFLLVTGQRRGEAAGLRWADLDLAARTWTLAAAATKAGRTHIVPLSPLAVSILETAPKLGPYVFSGVARRSAQRDARRIVAPGEPCPISGFAKAKRRIDRKVTEAGEAIQPWTLHDLRRTCATHLSRLGTPRLVIAKVLNHADRGVTGIYDRHEFFAEKRHALDAWGQYLAGLTEPPGANVVDLRKAAANG